MNVDELNDYSNWVGRTPYEIRQSVSRAGGWGNVFPLSKPFPTWASRIRNYFNVYPKWLKKLDSADADRQTRRRNKKSAEGGFEGGLAKLALSGDVYEDDNKLIWLEMGRSGSVYHYPDQNILDSMSKEAKSASAMVTPRALFPVFKLISPDGLGGSYEICLENAQIFRGFNFYALVKIANEHPMDHGLRFSSKLLKEGVGGALRSTIKEALATGQSSIGPVGEEIKVEHLIDFSSVYAGTFNYSETIVAGLAAHDHRDIQPHMAKSDFYIHPPRRLTLADHKSIKFPERDLCGQLISAN